MTRPALALLLALCLTLAAAPPAHAVLGDVDGSGRIDGVDLILLSRALGAARGQARFLDDGDLDGDGRITDRDLAIVRANFARSSRDPNVWVADTGNNRLVKLNVSTGRQMLTVPLPAPGRLALDSAAGEIWAVSDRETLVRVTSAGRVAARFGGFGAIRDLAIDTREGQVYALDTNLGRIFRISRESAGVPDAPALASVPGSALTSIDTSPGGQFLSIAADGVRGALWALGSNSRLLRIAADAPPNALSLDVPVTVFNGSVQATGRLALDPLDGSVVVTDQRLLLTRESGSVVLEHRVTRIPAGNAGELFSGGRGIGNFSGPGAVVVNAFDSSAWIADQPAGSAVLVKLDSRGREILRLRGFRGPVALSIDPLTGALWAADTGLDRVTKISPSGVRILELGGFSRPSDVAAAPGDTVKGAPIVSGVANPEAVPVGAPVELSGVAASLVSTIVRYEWDFDGNGSFDHSSPSSASTTHTYSREGIYTAILRVTDAQQLSSVDYSTVVRVGSLRVTLDIDPRSARGTAFARLVANSFSPLTGRIENVQFDFDGDGQFESFQATDSTSVEAFRLYNQPGSFRPAVKVVDPSGSTAQASTVFELAPTLPAPAAFARPSSGRAPLTVRFDPSSNSAGAPIVAYRWDFDGDGSFDRTVGPPGATLFEYGQPGRYAARLMAVDSAGLSATTSVAVEVTGTASPPRAYVDVSANPRSGAAPLAVRFRATASGGASAPARFDWRFGESPQGPGGTLPVDFTSSTTNTAEHTYGTAGTFRPSVTIVDSAGNAAAASLAVSVAPPGAPIAAARVMPGSGATPLDATLDSSASTGTIVRRQWSQYGAALADDFETDTGSFTGAGGWQLSEETAASGRRAWNDSPGGPSAPTVEKILLSRPFDLPVAGSAEISFRHRYDLADFTDLAVVEISADGGLSWGQIYRTVGSLQDFTTVRLTPATNPQLALATGKRNLRLRFRLTPDGNSTLGDGWIIDDVVIRGREAAVFETDAGTQAQLPVTYRIPGAHTAMLLLTGSGGLTATALTPVVVSDGAQPRTSPVISFSVGASELIAPGETFLSLFGSTRGSIVRHELDLDGDGTFDYASGPGFLRRFAFLSPGRYTIRARVTADDGQTAEASSPLLVRGPPPVAALSVAPLRCFLTTAPTFTVTASSPGGSPVTDAAIDFNGDSVFDASSGTVPFTTSFTFTADVDATPRARVRTQDGGETIVEAPGLLVRSTNRSLADPRLSATSGPVPLAVQFDAGPAAAPGGTQILAYLWDFDGNGTFDYESPSSPAVIHTFVSPGVYQPRLEIHAANDISSATAATIRAGATPTAIPRAVPVAGAAPLPVTFFTDGSHPNQTIERYEWDFEGDGVFDRLLEIPETVKFIYGTAGTYDARLRVTGRSGRSSTSTVRITATTAPEGAISASAAAVPDSGPAPLAVDFSANLTDPAARVTRLQWDFDGNGTVDLDASGGGSSRHIFTAPGDYLARVIITDDRGRAARRTVRVRASRPLQPTASLALSPPAGKAPLLVQLEAQASTQLGAQAVRFEWDFDGDGTFDRATNSGTTEHLYASPGRFEPRVRVTDSGGDSDVAQALADVRFGISTSHEPPEFDPAEGDAFTIRSVLATAASMTIRFHDRLGKVVRRLTPAGIRPPGVYTDSWDGKDGLGKAVPSGVYTYAIDYEAGTLRGTLDPSAEVNEARLALTPEYDQSFDPVSGKLLSVRFNLPVVAEGTAYVVEFSGGAGNRVKTLIHREPLTPGSRLLTWDGTDDAGNLVPGTTGYVLSLFLFELPKNAAIVAGRPAITDLTGSRAAFSPAFNPYRSEGSEAVRVSFSMSKRADVLAVIFDELNTAVRTLRFSGLERGPNGFFWDGLDQDGMKVDSGIFRIRVTATDLLGNQSVPTFLTVQVVY